MVSPWSSLMGATLSSMGRSVPSRAIRIVQSASPEVRSLSSAVLAGVGIGCLVSSLTMTNISSSRSTLRLGHAPAGQPLGDSVHEYDTTRGIRCDDGVADAHHGRLEPPARRSFVTLGPASRAAKKPIKSETLLNSRICKKLSDLNVSVP